MRTRRKKLSTIFEILIAISIYFLALFFVYVVNVAVTEPEPLSLESGNEFELREFKRNNCPKNHTISERNGVITIECRRQK